MRIAPQLMGGPRLTPVRVDNWLVAIKYHSIGAFLGSELQIVTRSYGRSSW